MEDRSKGQLQLAILNITVSGRWGRRERGQLIVFKMTPAPTLLRQAFLVLTCCLTSLQSLHCHKTRFGLASPIASLKSNCVLWFIFMFMIFPSYLNQVQPQKWCQRCLASRHRGSGPIWAGPSSVRRHCCQTLQSQVSEHIFTRAGEIPKFFEYRPSNPLNGWLGKGKCKENWFESR